MFVYQVKINLCFLFLLFNAHVHAQFMWQFKKDTVIKWYYYDGDEFSAKTIDREKWHTGFSWSELNYDMKFRMTPERLVMDNGVCKFMCYRDTGYYSVPDWQMDSSFMQKFGNQLTEGNKFKYYYTAGDVWSKGKYERGYFEIRFKTTGAYGMYPGYWLFGDNGDEIDFFELKGERSNAIHVDIHCKGNCDKNYRGSGILPRNFGDWIKLTEPLNESYNVLAGEWQNGYVKWYLNGEGIAWYTGDFEAKKMDLIFGTGVAQDGKPFAPGVNHKTVFPNSFDVDYVRVWYKAAKPKTEIKGVQHADFDFYPEAEARPAQLKRKIKYLYNNEFKSELLTISALPKKGKKIIISLLGKEKAEVSFLDTTGKIIKSEILKSSFSEFDFSSGNYSEVHIEIKSGNQSINEKITLVN